MAKQFNNINSGGHPTTVCIRSVLYQTISMKLVVVNNHIMMPSIFFHHPTSTASSVPAKSAQVSLATVKCRKGRGNTPFRVGFLATSSRSNWVQWSMRAPTGRNPLIWLSEMSRIRRCFQLAIRKAGRGPVRKFPGTWREVHKQRQQKQTSVGHATIQPSCLSLKYTAALIIVNKQTKKSKCFASDTSYQHASLFSPETSAFWSVLRALKEAKALEKNCHPNQVLLVKKVHWDQWGGRQLWHDMNEEKKTTSEVQSNEELA